MPPEEALREFSVWYGHIPIGGPNHLHEPFHEYAQWLKAHHLSHTRERLEDWIRHEYRSDDPIAAKVPKLTPGPRYGLSAGETGWQRRR